MKRVIDAFAQGGMKSIRGLKKVGGRQRLRRRHDDPSTMFDPTPPTAVALSALASGLFHGRIKSKLDRAQAEP